MNRATRLVLVLAGVLLTTLGMFAAENRPPAPMIVSPVNDSTPTVDATGLPVSGTGTPGGTVYVSVFSTVQEYDARVKADEADYQQFEKTHNFGGFGGQGALVHADGRWAFTVPSSALTTKTKDGVVYIAASQAVASGTSGDYPVSGFSPAVKLVLDPSAVPKTPTKTATTTAHRATTARSPSVFSDLAAFDWRDLQPAHVALTAGAALVLALLVGLPSHLLNTALDKGYDDRAAKFRTFVGRLTGRFRRSAAKRRTVPGPVWTVICFVLATVVTGFADPSFGVNAMSARLLLTTFITFVVLNVSGAYVTWAVTRASSGSHAPTFPAKPLNLVILVAAVITARLIHLEPTIIVGSLIGLDFGVSTAARRKGPVVLAGAAFAAVLAIVAWAAYSSSEAAGGGAWLTSVREFLSGLAVAGIASLPLMLLPFRLLDGDELFRWKKVAWGASYVVGMMLFLLVLLPMPFSWNAVSQPLASWVIIYLAYASLAVLVWAAVRYHWFRRRPRPTATSSTV